MWNLHKTVQENWLQWEKYCNPLITVESRTEDGIWQTDRTPSRCCGVCWFRVRNTANNSEMETKLNELNGTFGEEIRIWVTNTTKLGKRKRQAIFFPVKYIFSVSSSKTKLPENIHTEHRKGWICTINSGTKGRPSSLENSKVWEVKQNLNLLLWSSLFNYWQLYLQSSSRHSTGHKLPETNQIISPNEDGDILTDRHPKNTVVMWFWI